MNLIDLQLKIDNKPIVPAILDTRDIRFLLYRAKSFNKITDLLDVLLKEFTCREGDGLRLMQTLGYPYRRKLGEIIYCLNLMSGNCDTNQLATYNSDFIHTYKCSDDIVTKYIGILYHIHMSNLLYEKDHPPIDYYKFKKKSHTKRKTKVEDSNTVSKLDKLSIKIK